MKYILLYLFLCIHAVAQIDLKQIDPNKFTICAVTINSEEEKNIFSAAASKYSHKINPVVELTQFGDESDWFQKACKSGIRCDQLLISGHFAGSFFGESDKELSLSELESASCSKTCDGILKQPYEVFLFGCNTLATKDYDSRTPEQQVLLADGFSRTTAEMVVESRYGSVGDSNRSSMQRTFSGKNQKLYGFNSIGPSGKNIEGYLQSYFKKSNIADRLTKLETKRLSNQIEGINSELKTALSNTAFIECDGGNDAGRNKERNIGNDSNVFELITDQTGKFSPALMSYILDKVSTADDKKFNNLSVKTQYIPNDFIEVYNNALRKRFGMR